MFCPMTVPSSTLIAANRVVVPSLFIEGRIVGEFELPPAMRAETVGLPDRLNRRARDAGDPGHGAHGPVCCLVRRRLLRPADDRSNTPRRDRRFAGRPGPVMKQTVDALMHEPLLPAPHTGFRLSGLGHDRRSAQTIVAQKDDTRPPDMLLRVVRGRNDGARCRSSGDIVKEMLLRMPQTRASQSDWESLNGPFRSDQSTSSPRQASVPYAEPGDGASFRRTGDAYGTMGGEGLPQTQAAIFSRYVQFGCDLQAAVTAPRWLLGRTWATKARR